MTEPSSDRRRRSSRRAFARSALLLAGFLAGWPAQSWAASSRPDRDLYLSAKSARTRLESSSSLQKKKAEWDKAVARFLVLPRRYPRSAFCDDALMSSGDLLQKKAARFGSRRDLDEAVRRYNQIVADYPSSSLGEPALFSAFEIAQKRGGRDLIAAAGRRYLENYANSSRARVVRQAVERKASVPREALPKAPPKGLARVFNLRSWSGNDATRVVLDLERPVKFQRGLLEDPDRLYIDLLGTHLHANLTERKFPVGDGMLEQVRIGQFNDAVVRIVLDLKRFGKDTIFYIDDPTRLVIDVSGTRPDGSVAPPVSADAMTSAPSASSTPKPGSSPAAASAERAPRAEDADDEDEAPPLPARASLDPTSATPPRPNSSGSFSLVRQFGLGVRRIVIDPGHGGHDPGTIGRYGLEEKDLVLDVSLRVARMMRSQLGIDVVMTRTSDVYIPLEERTAIANAREADLFLSIHGNSSRSLKARGIETYYLNFAVDSHAEEVAARENAISPATVKDLSSLVKAITQNSKIEESRDFAGRVQRAMMVQMRAQDPRLPDRGVRRAPFYVLLGARMPSVLCEIAFLSNSAEEKRLKTSQHRDEIAAGIVEGVAAYIADLNGARAPRLTSRSDRHKVPVREARR